MLQLYDKENKCVLSRFLNVDVVGAVRMSGGKLFHAVGLAMENARLPSSELAPGAWNEEVTTDCRAESRARCDGCDWHT